MEAQNNELGSLVKALAAFHCPATTTRRKYACKIHEIQTCFSPQRYDYKTTCQTEGIPIFFTFFIYTHFIFCLALRASIR